MKVLVATARTQGDRHDDYHWCVEGELVRIGETCDLDRDRDDGDRDDGDRDDGDRDDRDRDDRDRDDGGGDGGCGCGRGFAGLNSHRATTTARIAEVPLSRADYIEAIRSSLEADGHHWCGDCAAEEADALIVLVADWPVGTVIERHVDQLLVRELADTG